MKEFDKNLRKEIENAGTSESKRVWNVINNSEEFNKYDLIKIHKMMENPYVEGQDWGNGPGSWNKKIALDICKANYPDADEYECYTCCNSNIFQPCTEGCVARYYANEKIQKIIEKELKMTPKDIYYTWVENSQLNGVKLHPRR